MKEISSTRSCTIDLGFFASSHGVFKVFQSQMNNCANNFHWLKAILLLEWAGADLSWKERVDHYPWEGHVSILSSSNSRGHSLLDRLQAKASFNQKISEQDGPVCRPTSVSFETSFGLQWNGNQGISPGTSGVMSPWQVDSGLCITVSCIHQRCTWEIEMSLAKRVARMWWIALSCGRCLARRVASTSYWPYSEV